MKKIFVIVALLTSVAAYSQKDSTPPKPHEKQLQLNRLETDSLKAIMGNISQRVAQIGCVSQADAAVLQQLLGLIYNTVARKEREALEAEKPKKG